MRSGRRIIGIVTLSWIVLTPLLAQQDTLQVLDAETGNPLPWASITLLDSGARGAADRFGRFIFSSVGPLEVRVEYVGCSSQVALLQPGSNVVLRLSPNPVALDEVVVTAQYRPTDLAHSLFEVALLNAGDIERSGATTASELLGQQLDIRLESDDVFGSKVDLGGIDGAHVLFLVDGVPLTGRLDNQLDAGQIPLADVKRVEIVRGPQSTVYGSNALGGVINFITAGNQDDGWSGRVTGFAESFGRYNADAAIGWRKKVHDLRLTGGRHFFNGMNKDAGRNHEWNPKEQYFVQGTYTYQKQLWSLGFDAKWFHEKILNRYDPASEFASTARDDYFRTDRQIYTLTQSFWGNAFRWDGQASFSRYHRTVESLSKDLTTLESIPLIAASNDTTDIYQWTLRGDVSDDRPGNKLAWNAGVDLKGEVLKAGRIQEARQRAQDLGFYGSIKYRPWSWLELQSGFRVTYNSGYSAPLAPSLHIRAEASQKLTVRASYARGFRAPSLKEQYLYFVDVNHNVLGNDSLKAERSHYASANLDMLHTFSDRLKLRWTESVYYNQVQDRISLALVDAASSLYTYVNLSDARLIGWRTEMQLEGDRWDASGGVSLNWTRESVANSDDYNLSPQLLARAAYRVPVVSVQLATIYKWTGQSKQVFIDAEDGSVSTSQLGSYSMWDLNASRSFWKDRISVTAGVRNLLDVTSVDATGLTGTVHAGSGSNYAAGMGRSYFAKLNWKFGK